jgi:hypothetical protein
LELPESAQLVSGQASLVADLAANVPINFSADVVFNNPGDYAIFCRALRTVSDDEVWGDLAELYLTVGDQFSELGFAESDTLTALGQMDEPGDGQPVESVEPAFLDSSPSPGEPPSVAPLEEGADYVTESAEIISMGSLTVTGKWSYYDRDDNYVGADQMLVELVRGDNLNHLAWCYTNTSGDYSCGPVTNPGGVGVRTRMHSYTSFNPNPDKLVVVNPDWGTAANPDNAFKVITTTQVFSDGTHSIGSWNLGNGQANERAFWVEKDLIDVWKYVFFGTGSSQSPQETTGPATVEWKSDSTHGTHYHRGGNIHLTAADPLSDTVVGHEYGHNIMWTIYGDWMPTTYCPSPHYVNGTSHINCAWTEGWANFITIAVNNDPVYRWASGSSINLETPTWGTSGWDDGDDVEGRVAGALWDIHDGTTDGFDLYNGTFADIWDTIYHQTDSNFREYWTAWKSRGHNRNDAAMSIYQNTIVGLSYDDTYEQNDTQGTATNFNYEGTWLSDRNGYGFQNDDDWYQIYVTPDYQQVVIDLRFVDSHGDIDLRLYNAAGGLLASSTSVSDNEYIDYVVPSGGYYYIKVYYDNAGNYYDLWWDDLYSRKTLSVNKIGTGSGTVTSSPAGINCGTDCAESYAYGTGVTLTASPATGSTFTGWSGACSGTGSCVVSMTDHRSVTANFTIQTRNLTVSKTGTGSGTVTSSPAGINCGGDCSQAYNYGTGVTLTATPATGSTFTGWSGACSGTGSCVVSMTDHRSVTAYFTIQTRNLFVSKSGTGSGTVTSSPPGIDCGSDCSQTYNYGTSVTLFADPLAGSTFAGWSGACSGTGSCVVSMTAARSVTATFNIQTHTLTVSKTGTGSGTVTSSPAGINCGGDCSETYVYSTIVTLTATPATGSTFTGWSGACTGTGSCQVLMTAARSVTANFTIQTRTLTVSKSGSGSGTVTSSPAGINCGGDCSQVYNYGTSVTLTATPAAGSTFTGWSGACSGTGSCVVSMTAHRSVTAYFTIQTRNLTVSKTGTGSGIVTSSPAGIDCGGDCSQTYNYGTSVTLYADPLVGSTFTGWSGACSGTGTCVVSMTDHRSVNANFTIQTRTLTVIKTGTGSGIVTSGPAGIDCGSDCTEDYVYGTSVTLTASPATGSTFTGWSGACSGTGSCVVSMTDHRSVTANFTIQTRTLTVSKNGTGSGTVTSSPAGIDCGGDCSQAYNYGTSVTLTATPATGSTFAGWSGACSGTGSCIVSMTAARSVTATFDIQTHTLTVSKSGSGSGTVTSSPAGIDCGSDCSQTYNYGTSVTLTASPAFGSTFAGWSGACSGTGSCVVSMTSAKSVTATFNVIPPQTLTVSRIGSGSGTITSSPAGIDCGSDCSEDYTYGTSVTLTASPAFGSTFVGWSGDCSGTGSCVVSMTTARSVTAGFEPMPPQNLTVSKTGPGSGTVTSIPAGIDCGSDCSEDYAYGTSVTLTASPADNSIFAGWSGDCSGTGSCVVSMTAASSVTAQFNFKIYTKKLRSQGKHDGWVLESGEFTGKGGIKNHLSTILQVGDDPQNKQYRVILSFGTASIPDNAVITKVILKVKRAGVVGTNPMNTHNGLVIDIKKGKFYTLSALQINDFQAGASKLKVGKFRNRLYSGWYKSVLYTGARPYINKTGLTQLRLRFLLDDNNDNDADFLKLYSGNAVFAKRPQMIVKYYIP